VEPQKAEDDSLVQPYRTGPTASTLLFRARIEISALRYALLHAMSDECVEMHISKGLSYGGCGQDRPLHVCIIDWAS